MASTFPAAIANEPPPLDISSEDEDSEEYRSHGLKLDVPSGEPTPVSTPFKRPVNKSPDKIKHAEIERANEELVLSVSPECSHDSQEVSCDPTIGPNAEAKVNGIGHTEETESIEDEDDRHHKPLQEKSEEPDIEKATYYCDSSSTSVNCTNSNISQASSTNPNDNLQTNKTIPDSVICDDEEFLNDTSENSEPSRDEECRTGNIDELSNPRSPEHTLSTPITRLEDEESEEFTNFRASDSERTSSNQESCRNDLEEDATTSGACDESNKTITDAIIENDNFGDDDDDDDFGAFQSIPKPPTRQDPPSMENEEEDDDDFGDFAQNSVQIPSIKSVSQSTTAQVMAQTPQDPIEEFADFQDCSFQSSDGSGYAKTLSTTSDATLISSKIDSIIKTLFVKDPEPSEDVVDKPQSIDSEISVSSDSTWAKVQDFEGSHALMFKWLGSLTGKRLLRSLNINTTNIVYHEKWGTIEVPKFAASLVQSPLQPQSCNKSESQSKSEEHPAIVNNNTILSDDHDKPTSISSEAQEILRQLPDLSYMRANTLVFPQSSPSGL